MARVWVLMNPGSSDVNGSGFLLRTIALGIRYSRSGLGREISYRLVGNP
jgi:hypothetical protein